MILRGKSSGRKTPPMLHLTMCGMAVLSLGMNMLLEFLSMHGVAAACTAAGYTSMILIILNKLLVFMYFVESIHALRACMRCRNGSCSWWTRCPYDSVWSVLAIVCTLGTFSVIVHATVVYGQGVLLRESLCMVSQSMGVVGHVLAWHAGFQLVLFLTLMGISFCTMRNFPKLNDVTACQYKIRSFVTKFIPVRPGSREEPNGSDVAVVCPAYLVPLNQRSAGACECSALKAMAALTLTIMPTVINLAILCAFHGTEPSWLSFLLLQFDSEYWIDDFRSLTYAAGINVVIIQLFNKNPERETGPFPPSHYTRDSQTLVSCQRNQLGASPTPSPSRDDLEGKSIRNPATAESLDSLRTFYSHNGHQLAASIGPRIPGSCVRRDSEASTIRGASIEQNRIGVRSGQRSNATIIQVQL
jgi:hypothetical protein